MAGKNKKKAFTLIELIVVMALVGVLGLGIAVIFVSANDSIVTLGQQTDVTTKTNFAMDTVQTYLKYAKGLTIHETANEAKEAGRTYLYSKDGRIYIQKGSNASEDMFNEAFYEGYYAELMASAIQQNIVKVTVAMTNKNDVSVAYSLETDVVALNTETVVGAAWGLMVSYETQNP
ncbi:MAG: type II secretion system protein [Christensenella sp.]|uniref:type II secretion system protein n=1 Tax=Christensenella sp. TaxID=1935934 RepID=UPI002B1FEEF5|nr:type II secretion system protein [Christensenella sp.]MEA5002011.1 type II secretion system protein [Christensenella sp.]